MEENVNFDNEVLAFLTIRKVSLTSIFVMMGRINLLRATSSTYRDTLRSERFSTISSPQFSFTNP